MNKKDGFTQSWGKKKFFFSYLNHENGRESLEEYPLREKVRR